MTVRARSWWRARSFADDLIRRRTVRDFADRPVPRDIIEAAMARRVVDLISLARKAGYAVAGFEKVKGWLADGKARVLFQASDGSDRGKGKLWTPTGGRWFGCLTSNELGQAFGRDYVIHAALAAGGLSARVVEEAAKLNGLRKVDGGASAGKETKSA